MVAFLVFLFFASCFAQSAFWTANFTQNALFSTGLGATGVNNGFIQFNWDMRTLAIIYKDNQWTELYQYNENYGEVNSTGSSAYTYGSVCAPTCGVRPLASAMPPLGLPSGVPSSAPVGDRWIKGAQVGTTGCYIYTPTQDTIVANFTMTDSGVVCSITFQDNRVFILANFATNEPVFNVPEDCMAIPSDPNTYCLPYCCGICVCGACQAPKTCQNNNVCTQPILANGCCHAATLPNPCGTSTNKCNLTACNANANGGRGQCTSTPVDCSGFLDGCTTYGCNSGTGMCTIPNSSACPPRDCTYGSWSQWTVCTNTCGNGTEARSRSINQTAFNGGAPCTGPVSDTRTCVKGCCPVPCQLSTWTQWGSCSQCGTGTQNRTRVITREPSCGGTACGGTTDTRNCPACVNRNCLGTNSTGTCNCTSQLITVTFRISQPRSGNGTECAFPDNTQWVLPCTASQNKSCPVPCNQSWTQWTACSCAYHVQNRSYSIYSLPRNGGTPCSFTSNFTQVQPCTPGPSDNCPEFGPLCVSVEDCNDEMACTVDECIFQSDGRKHCNWLNSVVCPVTRCMSSNTCDNTVGCRPVYKSVAQSCPSSSLCNKSQCIDSLNGGLGGCSYTITNCSSLTNGCQKYQCRPTTGLCDISDRSECPPVDCQWSSWADWSSCSASCGNGVATRQRTIAVAAADGGLPCTGSNTQNQACNTQCCPVSCTWAQWSSWSSCTVTCGGGLQVRSRAVGVPASCDGPDCVGASETRVCNPQLC